MIEKLGRGVKREQEEEKSEDAESQFAPLGLEPHEQKEVPMRFLTIGNRQHPQFPPGAPRHLIKFRRTGLCASLLALATIAANTGELNPQTSEPPPHNVNKPLLMPEANRPPDANDQMRMREQQLKNKNFEAANLERKRQISEDSAKLLRLATDLKTEVDKTSKDTLSLGIIRRADEIERIAHGVKEKMKLTMGAN